MDQLKPPSGCSRVPVSDEYKLELLPEASLLWRLSRQDLPPAEGRNSGQESPRRPANRPLWLFRIFCVSFPFGSTPLPPPLRPRVSPTPPRKKPGLSFPACLAASGDTHPQLNPEPPDLTRSPPGSSNQGSACEKVLPSTKQDLNARTPHPPTSTVSWLFPWGSGGSLYP